MSRGGLLFVVLIVLAVLAFVLLMPVFVEVCVTDDVDITVTYLFIRKQINKKSKTANERADSNVGKQKPKKKNFVSKLLKDKGPAGAVSDIIFIIKNIFKRVFCLISKFTVTKFNLEICVANKDAATAAIQYGGVCSVVYPVLGFLYSNLNFKNGTKVNIFCDYEASDSKLDFYSKFYILPVNAIFAACSFIFSYFLYLLKKTKDGVKNG
ncbi:MAG: DUF2953 domain-containing protein [bacterium]|nr:DUF2953 domain-containing protein [bacterium]